MSFWWKHIFETNFVFSAVSDNDRKYSGVLSRNSLGVCQICTLCFHRRSLMIFPGKVYNYLHHFRTLSRELQLFLKEKNWLSLQNCILRVYRNILMEIKILRKIIAFISKSKFVSQAFSLCSKVDWWVCQKFILLVHRNIFLKKNFEKNNSFLSSFLAIEHKKCAFCQKCFNGVVKLALFSP